MSDSIRKPAVAGMFYPDDPTQLQDMIQKLLQEAKVITTIPKALIAPHAGYIYSGPIAATVYATLRQIRDKITRIILLGPSHRVPFYGLSVSQADYFATPLGNVPLDKDIINKISTLSQVKTLEQAHSLEHSLEVQLPFLQKTLIDFSLVPLVVGDASPKEVAEVLEIVWGGEETLIVISSDLSHYHDYETAKRIDKQTSDAIEQLGFEKIHYDQACGRNPINGLLYLARKKSMQVQTVDLRNSGDTAGMKNQVVGYGAYVFN